MSNHYFFLVAIVFYMSIVLPVKSINFKDQYASKLILNDLVEISNFPPTVGIQNANFIVFTLVEVHMLTMVTPKPWY